MPDFIYNKLENFPVVVTNTNLAPKGDAGTKWYSSDGEPSDSLGLDGDYYLDNVSRLYYVKTGGSWVVEGNLSSAGEALITTNFDGILSPTENTIQKALDKLDDYAEPADAGIQTHITGDGSDHADVATNTVHSSGDGSDHANVALNDTHRGTVTGNPHNVLATQITDFDTEVDNNPAVVLNTAKVTNATHTGDVVGSTALSVSKTAITDKALATADGADYVLISDTSDTGNLKKALVSDLGDITGPASSTDNALARFDGITGKAIQESGIIVDDSENMTGVNTIKLNAISNPTQQEGLMFYDTDDKTFSGYTDISGLIVDFGEEILLRVRNISGVDITEGQVVFISGSDSGRATIQLAKADSVLTSKSIIGVAGHDINNNTNGKIVIMGLIHTLDTSFGSNGDPIYLSATVAGGLTTTRPLHPNYSIQVGHITVADAVNGEITVHISGRLQDIYNNTFNGCFLETIDFSISSDGATITGSLEQDGGGDLTMSLSGCFTVLDCTPAQTVVLTAGSATVPQINYIYILGSTKVLTASTTGWPATEHIKVSTANVLTAGATQTYGALGNRNWNDHIASSDEMGHLQHITERIRKEHAVWESGVTLTTTIVDASSPDDVYVAVSSGEVWQLHKQSFPALDSQTGDEIFVVNHNTTPYTAITNLNTQLADALGVSLSGRHFNLVLWGVQNRTGEISHLMLNLPSGSYSSSALAITDASNYSVFSIPSRFRGTGFLIARLTFSHSTAGGGTWTLQNTEDLRGKLPDVTAGSSLTTATTDFADGSFTLYNTTDNTKIADFDLSGLTTGTTRTITVPDSDITIGDATSIQGTTVDNADIADGKILKYNSTSGNIEWEVDSGTGSSAFGDLTDVTITSVATNDIVTYTGSGYVNRMFGHTTVYDAGSQATSYEINLDNGPVQTITATGDITLTLTGTASGESKEVTVLILASGANRTITFPAGWKFAGQPTSDESIITSGEYLMLNIQAIGTIVTASEIELDEVLAINADDIVDGSTNAVMTLVQETNFETAYTHSQSAHAPSDAEANNISDANATDLTDAGESALHYHNSDRARANHTGTQTASTISDFHSSVQGNRLDEMAVCTDITTNNATTSYHGLLPKLSGVVTEFLNGNGSFSVPAGGGDVVKVGTPVNNQIGVWTGDGTIEGDAGLTWDSATTTLAVVGGITVTGNVDGRDISADGTKLDFITITQAVDLDTLESDVTTNNAKVTNATHTGDVTGSTTLTIDNDAVTYAKMQNVVGNNVILGNNVGAGGPVDELTASEVRTIINVADGATANSSDATLLARANHTGTQTASTISDFDTEVANNTDVTANTAKVSNATHTGDVTGATALTIQSVAITGQTGVTADSADYVLISDTSDAGNLKKALVSDFGGGSSTLSGLTDTDITGGAKGDILVHNGTDWVDVTVGTNDQVLTADSAQTTGVKWSTPSGSGDVIKVGTPVDNQVGVWTGDGTIEGTSGLTYNGTTLDLTGNITLTGTVDGIDIATDVTANTAKVTNATHTGDVTGSGALTLASVAVTGQTEVTAVGTDYILISDTSDSGNLKKALASDFGGSVAMADITNYTETSVATNDTIVYTGAGYENRQTNHVNVSTKSDQAGPTYQIDLDGGVFQAFNATGNITLSITGTVASQSKLIHVLITASGADRTITFPAGWDWLNAPPSDQTIITSGSTLYLALHTNGTQVIGALKELNEDMDINADWISDGTTNAIITLTQETNFETAYTHSQVVTGNPHSLSLNDLSDVTETSVATNEILQYTGAGWENQTFTEAGIGSVTSVTAGNGLDFTTITTTGAVTLGTPSTLTTATTNGVTATSHTHALTLPKVIKSLTVESPTATEDICMFYVPEAMTISNVYAVVKGTTPSVTINPVQTTDRSSAGTAILTTATAITNTTTGQNLTSFNDATVPSGSWIVFKTTAQSGTVTELTITIAYDID